ncbi:MAG: UDP-N-acetylmuramate:L-alanyl-gamma-D-glutamyl-meso-diaminopimelate ligase [Gammaproteobacteria bacterium]|nr:UDP-N-acetylmuramate:L-alanyl-gamma-D-glutamyl-meso-diaminopimelate ligase [Gammaproteobacteria bacterium]
MHIHIAGICGTFMAGVAQLARELGHRVSGSDANVYPPMSDFLQAAGIPIRHGWDPAHLADRPDLVVIGNALSRGNPLVEAVLDAHIPYTSGPAWLAQEVLQTRHVLAVAGTHGKTTTSSMLAHLLEAGGLSPGFLIGGIPGNFGVPARRGQGRYFVIEADEYDSAFFDKRSKFVHYRPDTLVINNLEFDHADIFPDLTTIQTQFHHLVRTVPSRGRILWNADEAHIPPVLARGLWSESQRFGTAEDADWRLLEQGEPAQRSLRIPEATVSGSRTLTLPDAAPGRHNALNAIAAIAAASHAGVPPDVACAALARFRNTRRRLEVVGEAGGVTIIDDFAHHPTAIAATLAALRERVGAAPIIAVLEPRSNTMRMGVHKDSLGPSLTVADEVLLLMPPGLDWDTTALEAALAGRGALCSNLDLLLDALLERCRPGAHVIIMSNGDFGGIHQRLLQRLSARGGDVS